MHTDFDLTNRKSVHLHVLRGHEVRHSTRFNRPILHIGVTMDLHLTKTVPRRPLTEKHFLDQDVRAFTEQLAWLDRKIDRNAVPKRDNIFSQLADAVRRSEAACQRYEGEHGRNRELVEKTQKWFLKETAHYFNQSWISQRVRTKPRGFPGDYKMLEAIYDNKAIARGLGGYLDLYLLELPLAVAVRARLRAVRQFLQAEVACRKGEVRVLDIASGPCREYCDWQKRPSKNALQVTCIDNDQEALDYVDANVVERARGLAELRSMRYNALRTRAAKRTIAQLGRFDVIYSVGLCDYLTDEQLIGMFQGWRETLDENGVLYISFKDANRYDKTPYQWHLDWFFLQRSEQDCWRLFEKAGFDVGSMESSRDETGIVMNFVYRRVPSSIVRIDPPEQYRKPISLSTDFTNHEEVPGAGQTD